MQVRLIIFSEENAYPFLTESLDWKIVPASISLSVLHKNQYNISALQQTIEDFASDVIHTHLFEAEIVSRSCYYPKAKWVSHCHDNMKQFRNLDIRTFFNKELFTNYFEKQYLLKRYEINGGNTFVCISRDTERYFKRSATSFSTVLLRNAINYLKFYKEKSYDDSSKLLQLIHVGSFNRNKNQCFLIKVAQNLRERMIPFELHFLGDGGMRNDIEQKVVDVWGRIAFTKMSCC